MEKTTVTLGFEREFSGTLYCDNTSIEIGTKAGKAKPYDLLLGALGSCLYATFAGIAKKMKLTYDRAEIKITGEKREEIPTTLKKVLISFVFYGVENPSSFPRAVDLAAKYCSIHSTIEKVAEIAINVKIESEKE